MPWLDALRSPLYELIYIMQIPTPVLLSLLYMPFVSLFAAFALFGKAMLQILANKLTLIGQLDEEQQRYEQLLACIRYHMHITR